MTCVTYLNIIFSIYWNIYSLLCKTKGNWYNAEYWIFKKHSRFLILIFIFTIVWTVVWEIFAWTHFEPLVLIKKGNRFELGFYFLFVLFGLFFIFKIHYDIKARPVETKFDFGSEDDSPWEMTESEWEKISQSKTPLSLYLYNTTITDEDLQRQNKNQFLESLNVACCQNIKGHGFGFLPMFLNCAISIWWNRSLQTKG